MNKMLIFPLALMFVISLIVSLQSSIQPVGTTGDYSQGNGVVIIGDETTEATVIVADAGSKEFNIWGTSGILIILIAGVIVGVAAGVHFIGSGLSGLSQAILVDAILFLGLWTCLTVVSSTLFFTDTVGTVTWLGITMVYMVGLSMHMTGNVEA